MNDLQARMLSIVEERSRGPLGHGCGRDPVVPVGPLTHSDIVIAAVAVMVIVGVLLFVALW